MPVHVLGGRKPLGKLRHWSKDAAAEQGRHIVPKVALEMSGYQVIKWVWTPHTPSKYEFSFPFRVCFSV